MSLDAIKLFMTSIVCKRIEIFRIIFEKIVSLLFVFILIAFSRVFSSPTIREFH
jgi:hypothetical protein